MPPSRSDWFLPIDPLLPEDHHTDLSMHRYFEHRLRFDLHVRGFLTNLIDASAFRPPHTIDWRCVQDQPGRTKRECS